MASIPPDYRQALPTETETGALSRRGFLTTSLAVGFAAAVQPVHAEVISTSDEGLIAGSVRVPVAGGAIPAYEAYPAVGGPFPTVVVIQEIFGVHEHIRDVCRRFAKLGYYAISGELYARQGDVAKLTDINDIIKIVATVPDNQVNGDIDSLVDFARSSGKADTTRLGVTGFCWGGRATWLYAAHNPGVKAAVAWYGLIGPPMWDKNGTTVFQVANKIRTPVLGLFAEQDKFIPVDQVEKLRAQLKGHPCDLVVYPGVQHGFHADYRPSYNKAAAEDGWGRLQAWFKRYGVS
ncbi:MAG TPA: dienelactone hydrolase family protein [Rhodospirillaceae bacterium]|nr:dienelactone hydrolase family protein [Rhodospirillaceae bacterium]